MSERTSTVVTRMLERDAFSRWLGIEMLDSSAGRCSLRMKVREEMLNGFGVGHGAIVFALADSAMAFACNSSQFVTMAIDNSISYPAAVKLDDELVALAQEESSTGKLAFYRVTVRRRDNAIVAIFRGTVYRTRQEHQE